ncbi:HesB/IscA family protein [Gracilimonas mengyeensis]|uniref:Iron-sulfur cluster assembly protein n=1 Tax=Gracilimonas mengyeensis TaxID=1302730 RepID=A0A521DD93_9BACT|nr:iron-sulfur cluster assembly accessory protein [Gracilimonas mengyeensis]SMO69633.1 iron-sulfur cluster assembly protein [Gracilimonas mengyeensis]
MSVQEENLDDVISSLIDVDEEDETTSDSTNPFEKDELTGEPVILTERAARQVEKIKADEGMDDNLYLRVAVDGGGCSGLSYKLGLDYRTDEDKVYESYGVEIIVAPKHLMYVEGMQIDYPDGLDARGFTFDNPNAVENCGCGTSFAV